jgi:ribonuclease P protein component
MDLPGPVPAQVMVTVGKRNFKDSHDRNRIKRLIREVYRVNKHEHYAALHKAGKQAALMFIFTGRQLPEHGYIKDKITSLLNRFTQVVLLKVNQPKE